ncbi:hypothetical protein GPECTOR_79g134 [Gonium pectorale]|uniref:Uncharacterized protein n=1 Tax=Gonium pectorale TaxID=33097 RepID=A0A150G2W7_GONPE|nr:hypothetical protein GPECTOR_79g134 [Gonium pectorale]|eukprot:KXZ43855.1 hypothetical protein GPECTOR_79g134 [Gonium pectorale]
MSSRPGLPLSSSSGPGPSLRQYHSPMRKWVWAAFAVNVALASIFAALCASSYKAFTAAIEQLNRGEPPDFPAGSRQSDWEQLFAAAAISAAFAVALTVLFHFRGYGPTLATWHHMYKAPFNTTLLNTTVVFGLLSFLNYTLLAGLLAFWQDPVDVYLLDRREMSPAGVQI